MQFEFSAGTRPVDLPRKGPKSVSEERQAAKDDHEIESFRILRRGI